VCGIQIVRNVSEVVYTRNAMQIANENTYKGALLLALRRSTIAIFYIIFLVDDD
jgi:hypothetical protein